MGFPPQYARMRETTPLHILYTGFQVRCPVQIRTCAQIDLPFQPF